jgi:hypothetical protein
MSINKKGVSVTVTLLLMCVFLYSVPRGLESLGSGVHAQASSEIAINPGAQYVEQAIRFDSTEQFNAWRRKNPKLEIIERKVNLAASAALVGATFTTGEGKIDRTVYTITIFYRELVPEEEEE